MMIRQDFRPQLELPPRLFLEQLMNSLSKIYCFLWDHKNDENIFEMTWKQISVYYNKNAFRSNLRKMLDHGLVSYRESNDGIEIELTGWDEFEE
jgi:hypothetical protein